MPRSAATPPDGGRTHKPNLTAATGFRLDTLLSRGKDTPVGEKKKSRDRARFGEGGHEIERTLLKTGEKMSI